MSIKQAVLKLYFLMRLPLLAIMASVFRIRKLTLATKPQKILIIRLDRLGDFVLTLPVIENIKAYYPDAKINVLVRPYLQKLAKMIKSIDEVIIYDGFIKTAKRVKRGGFDLAIDMLDDYPIKSVMLALLSGAPRRAGFAGGFREFLFTDAVYPAGGKRSMVDINLELVGKLGIPVKATIPKIILNKQANNIKPTMTIHPGAKYPSQRWGAEKFAVLAVKISESYDVDIIIIGSNEEKTLVENIIKQTVGNNRIKTVFPELDGLVHLLAGSILLVCNNSGPLHLAAAMGIPTISMMGPTDPHLWWPQGERNIVIRKELPCSPCGFGRCGVHECLESITVDEVFEKVKAVLDGIPGIKRH